MGETVHLLESTGKHGRGKKKMKAFGAATAFLVLTSLYLFSRSVDQPHPIHHYNTAEFSLVTLEQTEYVPSDYLIWSPNCRIPNIDPHAKDAMEYFQQKKYQSCSQFRATQVIQDEQGKGILQLNISTLDKHTSKQEILTCCYYIVAMHSDPKLAITKATKSKCNYFNTSVTLKDKEEFIITKCETKNKRGIKKVYEDAHTNIQISEEVKQRTEALNANSTKKPWNVLIIGIDTLSRINLARAMPKTNNFLKNNSWLDFQAYNKIDDNTYPNLMAILVGRNQSRARKLCDGAGNNSADNCDFMWKRYQNVGYVTVYAEDYAGISTFGKPLHSGFTKPPTDHYLTPLFLAAEKHIKKNSETIHCTGQTTSGELTLDYALKFVNKYQNIPFFGFFWMNTFSHDDISLPTAMDEKVATFFEKMNRLDIMNTTIIIFISDHGLRYGNMRSLLTGYYEERLPAFFIWLPTNFKEMHPDSHHNMMINTKRLTTPYDLYMTLEDILRMSGKKSDGLIPSEACPVCQSLFTKIPWNRSCSEVAISPHWCTCNQFQELNLKHDIANRAVKFVVNNEIENVLNTVNTDGCRICAKLKIEKILHLYLYKYLQNTSDFKDYLVVFSTKPGTMTFEATVRHYERSDQFEVQNIVSRLTAYKGKGGCVKTAFLKKYCYCTNAKCHQKL